MTENSIRRFQNRHHIGWDFRLRDFAGALAGDPNKGDTAIAHIAPHFHGKRRHGEPVKCVIGLGVHYYRSVTKRIIS